RQCQQTLRVSIRGIVEWRRVGLDAERDRREERIGGTELRASEKRAAETLQAVVPQCVQTREVVLQRVVDTMQLHPDAAIHPALRAQRHESRMHLRGSA